MQWVGGDSMKNRTLVRKLRYPKAGIAPGWFNWGLENLPYAFQRLSRTMKDGLLLGRGRYGPAGAAWLKPRVVGIVILHEMEVMQALKVVLSVSPLTLSNNDTLITVLDR